MSQQIELAKIICPVYDPDAEVWLEVIGISENMNTLKKEIASVEHSQLIALGESDTSSNLVSQFLNSVVSSPVKSKLTKEIEAVPTYK